MADTDDTPWQAYLRANPRQWHQVATDVRWDTEHDQMLADLGLDPNEGFGHAAEAVTRNPDGGLNTVNIWALYREPGSHANHAETDPTPPFMVAL